MDNAPAESKTKKGKGGRTFRGRFSDAVKQRARDYQFIEDIDETSRAAKPFVQKVGMTDFDFVQALANLTGFIFWVDGDLDGNWTLHFKNPEDVTADTFWPAEGGDPRKYNFRYDQGDLSSLLSFDPELSIQGAHTELKVRVKNSRTGRVIEADFKEDNLEAPETTVITDGSTLRVADQALEKEHTSGSSVKLFLGEFSIDVIANRTFQTKAELVAWSRQWYRRNRENFVLGNGALIGVELLRARQIHEISGIGIGLDGDYEFTRVRHVFSNQNGYTIDFSARKRVPTFGG